MYYVYLAAVAIFCPNSINILAGINGIEVAQSLVIAALLLLNDALYLLPPRAHPAADAHTLSAVLLLPFVGVSAALAAHNWYPARVFGGDTYCYFAGMLFAAAATLGHFSKTLLLLLLPQLANAAYGAPQLLRVVPCPRHRLPRFNARTGLLEPSTAAFAHAPPRAVGAALRALHRLRLARVETNARGEVVECTNLTLLNLWLLWRGPMREDRLALSIVGVQIVVGLLALLARHRLASLLFTQDNFP
jgi:UDP-N-acetylglucosamine--dolichyl-phosphate N-acetylglucosaminephosphotransferase